MNKTNGDRARNGAATHNYAQKSAPLSASLIALQAIAEPQWTGNSYAALASHGYMRNPIVHRSVRLIAENVASIPWTITDGVTEYSDHAVIELLKRPAPMQDGRSFMETLVGHLLLAGNAFAEIQNGIGNRRAMFALRPDRVKAVTDDAGWTVGYHYEVEGKKRAIAMSEDPRGAQPLLHVATFHPLSDQEGFGPLGAAAMALDIHNAAARWNKSLLDNAARPSGALVYAPGDHSNLSEEQFERLKKELEEGYSGAINAGKPMVLEGGLDWKAMALTPKDMDFIEAKNTASREIALAFGVPPMLLGIPGDNTYSNYQEANRAFFRLTVLPLAKRLADAFANWLSPHFSTDLKFSCNLDEVPGLAAEREALWKRVEAASFLTEDEKRVAVGFPPLATSR
ncbi:MAG: phage portal protein [Pseudomonadota bacterium]